MQNKIIGIAGCARSGKDTFFNILKKYLPEVEQVALAGELKKDLDDFVKSKIGISVFTDDTKEKSLIRGLMVEYEKSKDNKLMEHTGLVWLKKRLMKF
jgi:ABC-type uncharacterized transport system ATPase subunit